MVSDLSEMVLTVYGGSLAQAAGAVAALYAFLVLVDALRRAFSNREE